ncbi:MAG: hypothetical protein K0S32_4073 [Bacteroidetes bacterium]|nr:hypothetical protein [Bacteroidota bacterium]
MIFIAVSVNAQHSEIASSNTSVKTCVEDKQCSSIDDASYLFYDESKNEFYLKVDFTKFDSEEDSADSWLNDLMDTHLYFKGYFEKEKFIPPSGTNSSSFKVNGKTFLNGKWNDQVVDMTVFTMENTIVVNQATDKSKYDQYKVNFSLSIFPKDFNVQKKAHHLNNVIYIDVALGRINLLRPGMEHLVKEAYDYH